MVCYDIRDCFIRKVLEENTNNRLDTDLKIGLKRSRFADIDIEEEKLEIFTSIVFNKN